MCASLYLAFTRYSIQSSPQWVGLLNFKALLLGWGPNFYNSLRVTFIYMIQAVPLPVAASGIIWAWVFNPKYGILNRLIYVTQRSFIEGITLTGMKG